MTRNNLLKKNFLLGIILLCCLLLLFPQSAWAEPDLTYLAADGNTYGYQVDGGEAYITSVVLGNEQTTLIIPATIEDIPVVGIEDNAFKENQEITAVTIPEGIVSIGERVFELCKNLQNITLPQSLRSIGFAAFCDCHSLEEITLPTRLSGTLNGSLLQNCTSLQEITIPQGITELGGWAFCGCTNLEQIHFASDSELTTIGRQVFTDCTSLESIEIPESFTTISYDSFKNCTSLTDVYFLGDVSNVTFINWGDVQYNAWQGCADITFHAFADFYKGTFADFIEQAAPVYGFSYEEIPTTFTISAAVGSALGGHMSPAGNVSVSRGADQSFQFTPNENYRISSIVVDGKDVGAVSSYTFYHVTENHTLIANFEPVTLVEDITFTYDLDGGEATITGATYTEGAIDLIIPATIDGYPVVGIGESAFEGNTDILSLTLPEGLREIGQRAFYECTALKHIDFPESLRTMGFAAFYGCSSLTEAVLPKAYSGVLQNSVFQDCTSLKRVNIPEGVTAINGWAFCGCTSLEQVYFNGVSQLSTIDRQAFDGCAALKELHLPARLQSLVYHSFRNATSLQDVYFYGDPSAITFINWDSIDFAPFTGCDDLTFHSWNQYYAGTFQEYIEAVPQFSFQPLDDTCTIGPDGNTYFYTITNGEASITDVQLTGSTDLVFPSQIAGCPVTELADKAFRAMGDTVLAEKPMLPYTDITSVVLPEGLEVIGNEAFYACTSLRHITIPSSVTTIRSGAFCYCYSLEEIKLPDSLTGPIGDVMFWGCYNLKSVNIPEGVSAIGRWVFYDCRQLKEITIPSSVTSIDKESFEQCISLEKVTFAKGSKCTSIGQQVFWNCPKLTTINLPDNLNFIGVETFRNCTALKNIDIPQNVSSIGVRAFQGCSALEKINLYNDISYMDERIFDGCTKLTDVYFYGDVSQIAFHKTTFNELTDIVFHADPDKAAGLQDFVNKYATERNFRFQALSSKPSPNRGSSGGGTIRLQYSIQVSTSKGAAEGVSRTISLDSGEEQTLSFDAAEGYRIKDVIIDGVAIGAVKSYTFSNVTANHTVYVVYEVLDASTWDNPFQDVGPADYYAGAVQTLYQAGLMNGTSSQTFSPEQPITRGMLVTVLYRLEGQPQISAYTSFQDVVEGAYYQKAVAWAEQSNLVQGYGNGIFGVADTLTREQLAAILYRYAQMKGYETAYPSNLHFNDENEIADWAEAPVHWAAAEGLLIGKGNGNIASKAAATRGEVAIAFAAFVE